MTYSVRPATLADAAFLSTRLRDADVAEIKALTTEAPVVSLSQGVKAGRCWVGVDGEGAAGIFGVAPSPMRGVGHPWMMATDRLENHQRQFLRECGRRIADMHRDFPTLTNVVDARNYVHIKWLAWCGFEFIRLLPRFGVEQRPFYHFQRSV